MIFKHTFVAKAELIDYEIEEIASSVVESIIWYKQHNLEVDLDDLCEEFVIGYIRDEESEIAVEVLFAHLNEISDMVKEKVLTNEDYLGFLDIGE